MANSPVFVSILFLLTALLTIWFFFHATHKSYRVLGIIILWGIVQSVLAFTGFYQNTDTIPPRFFFLVGPGFILILFLFLTRKGRLFIDSLDIKKLTLLHIVRVPVEIVLYYISLAKLIPVLMTFEGRNFDILAGITAPIIYYLVFSVKKINWKILLAWNIACLILLINIIVIAILSAKTPFQQFAFDQPNIGLALFPFVLLPSVIVPIVLLSHLASIRRFVLHLHS